MGGQFQASRTASTVTDPTPTSSAALTSCDTAEPTKRQATTARKAQPTIRLPDGTATLSLLSSSIGSSGSDYHQGATSNSPGQPRDDARVASSAFRTFAESLKSNRRHINSTPSQILKTFSVTPIPFEKCNAAKVLVLLANNAIRIELMDLERMVAALERRKYVLTAYDAGKLQSWLIDFYGFLMASLFADQEVLFAWARHNGGLPGSMARSEGRNQITAIASAFMEVLAFEDRYFHPNINRPFGELITSISKAAKDFIGSVDEYLKLKEAFVLPALSKAAEREVSSLMKKYFRSFLCSSSSSCGHLYMILRDTPDVISSKYRSKMFVYPLSLLRYQASFRWYMHHKTSVDLLEHMAVRAGHP